MNCAWCSPSNNGTDGICDACMLLYFRVDPATIHAEITAEATHTAATKRINRLAFPLWKLFKGQGSVTLSHTVA